jgi:hypothetical protein
MEPAPPHHCEYITSIYAKENLMTETIDGFSELEVSGLIEELASAANIYNVSITLSFYPVDTDVT